MLNNDFIIWNAKTSHSWIEVERNKAENLEIVIYFHFKSAGWMWTRESDVATLPISISLLVEKGVEGGNGKNNCDAKNKTFFFRVKEKVSKNR